MNIYLLEQNYVCGYDTYDSLVVYAEDEEKAKLISPYGGEITDITDRYATWVGKDNIDKIKITYLGTTTEEKEEGIILASFNAG